LPPANSNPGFPMPRTEHGPGAGRPRPQRDLARMRQAAEAAQTESTPALAVALAQIGAAFGEAAAVNGFKIRIEEFMRRGAHHPAVRARFGARAEMLFGRNFDAANVLVERWWREERKAFQIASALGCATRLSLEVLRELRLILRLLRRKGMTAEYDAALAALCDASVSVAAE
jgi:hypothetical protein